MFTLARTIHGALIVLISNVLALQVNAATIDFEGISPQFGSGPLVLTDATFTSSTGTWRLDAAGGTAFCAHSSSGGGNCLGVTTVDFTQPVSNLTFVSRADNASGIQSTVDVYVNGIFDSTVNISYDGDGNTNDLVDLSGFSDVTKLILTTQDSFGVGWDDFTYAVVPVPAAVWLFGGALGALGWARRRQAATA
jgi:hypothetical protein